MVDKFHQMVMDLYLDIPVRHMEYKTPKLLTDKKQTKFNTNRGNWIVIDDDYRRIILNDFKGSKKKW